MEKLFNQVIKRSPSNIAIVKYWGKHGNQLPNNPSISFTLSRCYTETKITWKEIGDQIRNDRETKNDLIIDFYFEGNENQAFKTKIEKYLQENKKYFSFLKGLHLKIESSNSFPHSSGIASSASSMSALILCLMEILHFIQNDKSDIDLKKASFLSRLASGSASRSIYPIMALWGKTPSIPESSDEYAVPLGDLVHSVFKTYHDSILIVNSKQKKVSSRIGHSLMNNHPQAESRYAIAKKNTENLLKILQDGDLEGFIKIVEAEARQLHELMATSTPAFNLMKANTIRIIDRIINYRKNNFIPICYTLDAGPNVHLLYPDFYADKVKDFINDELKQYCFDNKFIDDKISKEKT